MALPTLGVHDKDGADVTINTLPNAGQATKANSLPVVLPSDQVVLTQDCGPGDGSGIMQTPFHGDASTAQEVSAAPTTGQKLVVTDIFISTAAAAEIHLEEETSGTTIFGPLLLPATFAGQFTPRGKLKLATADRKVKVHSSTADHITCQISCVSEA